MVRGHQPSASCVARTCATVNSGNAVLCVAEGVLAGGDRQRLAPHHSQHSPTPLVHPSMHSSQRDTTDKHCRHCRTPCMSTGVGSLAAPEHHAWHANTRACACMACTRGGCPRSCVVGVLHVLRERHHSGGADTLHPTARGCTPLHPAAPSVSLACGVRTLLLGSIAILMTGSGKSMRSRMIGCFSSHSVSPVGVVVGLVRRSVAGSAQRF
jgi:hypothetical protein